MNKKNWLITGISSGLGKALAESVLEQGDFVIGTFRTANEVEAFNAKYGNKAKGILLDVTDEVNVARQIEEIVSNYSRIDVLVNNAGLGFIGAIEEASVAEVRSVFEPNFFGALNLTQKVLPVMRNQKRGHIVQISSQAGIKAAAGFGIYNASKFALEGFSEALAQEVEPLGIRVSIVEPGPFRTKFAGENLGVAKRIIEDYTTTSGVFRTKLKSVDGKQEGDPVKAAKAIINQVEKDKPTLRLPLGKIAVASIEAKLTSLRTDLETNRSIAESVVYD